MKKLIILLLISAMFMSCSSSARITDISNPTVYRDIKIKKNMSINNEYVLIHTKKGTPQMIYRDIYTLEINKH